MSYQVTLLWLVGSRDLARLLTRVWHWNGQRCWNATEVLPRRRSCLKFVWNESSRGTRMDKEKLNIARIAQKPSKYPAPWRKLSTLANVFCYPIWKKNAALSCQRFWRYWHDCGVLQGNPRQHYIVKSNFCWRYSTTTVSRHYHRFPVYQWGIFSSLGGQNSKVATF